jgi:DNA-binding GntR family transcriptional regulator
MYGGHTYHSVIEADVKPPSSGGRLLYEVARETIETRIKDGIYDPDEPLPSVLGFVKELKVSAITVRRALADLQNAGLLRTVRGLGTFINTSRRFVRHLNRGHDPLFGAFEEAQRLGKTATTRTLSVELRDPQDPAFQAFDIAKAKHVCINKLVLIDGEPMMLEHTFVTTPIDRGLLDEFAAELMYRVLRQRKFKIRQNRFYFDAAPASPDVSATLAVPAGYPTIRHFYNPVIRGGKFSIYGVSIAPFDRLAYAIDVAPALKARRS